MTIEETYLIGEKLVRALCELALTRRAYKDAYAGIPLPYNKKTQKAIKAKREASLARHSRAIDKVDKYLDEIEERALRGTA